MKRAITTGWLVGCLALGLAQDPHAGHAGMAMQSMTVLEKKSGRAFDLAYMSQMIAHHQGAVEMAQALLKASKAAELRKAAQAIVKVQQAEVTQLKNWLRSWYQAVPDPAQMALMKADMQPMMEMALMGMTPMEGHQMPIERSFLEGMIPHHQDAVAMSQLCLKRAARAELKKFCTEVIRVQQTEVKQYQAWLKKY